MFSQPKPTGRELSYRIRVLSRKLYEHLAASRSCAFWSAQKRLVKVSENQKTSSGYFACHANQNGPILTEEFSSAFSHVFRTTSGTDIAISACWNNLRGWVAIWRLYGVCDKPTRFWLLFVNRRTVSEVQNHTNLAIFNVLADQDQPAWNTLSCLHSLSPVSFSKVWFAFIQGVCARSCASWELGRIH